MASAMKSQFGTKIFGAVRPKGKFPLGRTVDYLKRGKILKPGIENVAVYFMHGHPSNVGMKEFIFYNLPQLVYVNPDVQFNTFKSQKHASIDFYLTGGERIQVNLQWMSRKEICEVVIKIGEKSPEQIEADKKPENVNPERPKYVMNPYNFGFPEFGQLKCICSLPGQVPCSRYWKYWPEEVKAQRAKIKAIGKGHTADSRFYDLDDKL